MAGAFTQHPTDNLHNNYSQSQSVRKVLGLNVERSTHLSQLFVQVGGVDLSSFSQLIIKHLLIPRDEIGAKEFLHLHRHVHGHWDDVIKQDHESQEVCEGSDNLTTDRENVNYELKKKHRLSGTSSISV